MNNLNLHQASVFTLTLVLGACATSRPNIQPTAPASAVNVVSDSPKVESVKVLPQNKIETTTLEKIARAWNENLPVQIEMRDHPLVDRWMAYFLKRDPERFQRHLDRAEPYRRVVTSILRRNGVPEEVFYLGLIESGYRSEAKSHASAVGVWQFIRGTGHRYGLKINSYVDERRDPFRATEAAARYLRDLYNVFNSWELALAAYNAGEGRILRAVMVGKTRDYWELVEKKVLPDETLNYVPKFIAAVKLGENYSKYGFSRLEDAEHPRLDVVEIPAGIRLATLASKIGIPVASITDFNGHLLRGMTPPGNRPYRVWVPMQHMKKVEVALGDSALLKQSLSKTRGFSQIEKQKNLNRVSASRKRSVGARTSKNLKYKVRRGDNLVQISEKFGVSIRAIKQKNAIRGTRIYAGDVIKIPTREI